MKFVKVKRRRWTNLPSGNRRMMSVRIRRLYKRLPRKIEKGLIHIHASSNNTIISITDVKGEVVSWDSAGTCRFKGPKRKTPHAAQTATKYALHMLLKHGMERAAIMLNGAGPGRVAALRTVCYSGLKFDYIRDVTPMPHNGCRPPKRRRV